MTYCVITDGDAGGIDRVATRVEVGALRRREQVAAAAVLGVRDVHFLGYKDGELVTTLDLRRDISRVIRRVRPQRILIHSPERNWDRLCQLHPDHLAAGDATMAAIYPVPHRARNRWQITGLYQTSYRGRGRPKASMYRAMHCGTLDWRREWHRIGRAPRRDSGIADLVGDRDRERVQSMRRLTALLAGGAIWLALAAVPAMADGGPHVAGINSGASSLAADSCAGCHRAHTAQGSMLLAAGSEEELCLTCHGAASAGATTSVTDGIQYVPGTNGSTNVVLGALRGGGFVNARIDAGNAYRATWGPNSASHPTIFGFDKKVRVGASEAATSGHMKLAGANGVTLQNKAWGNGAFSQTANAGPTVTLGCASCHNPHGNGQYRILNPIPNPETGTVVSVSPWATSPVKVKDAPNPGNATRNYTVIQYKGPLATNRYLLASEIVADGVDPTAGDYLHQIVPYNARTADDVVANHDGPNGDPAYFTGQMNAWCATCHSRYQASTNLTQVGRVPVPGSVEVPGNLRTRVCQVQPDGSCVNVDAQPMVTGTNDAIYDYRHTTARNRSCLTCHVSHGSNAAMTGASSSLFPYPDGTLGPSSRLLKVDNRGTCQVCHDPTETSQVGDITNGPAPALP